MKFIYILTLIALFSCGQDFNSNSLDDQIFQDEILPTDPAELRLYHARKIFNSKCVTCHKFGGYHSSYSSYTTDEAWINNSLVTPGDFAGSFIVVKLKNYGGNMPDGASALTAQEITVLQDWINNL